MPYFMISSETKEFILTVCLPAFLSIGCFIFGNWILPKNCTLFVSNSPGPQMCHTIPSEAGCFDSFCQDTATELTASIIVGLGIFLLVVPIIVFLLKDSHNKPFKETKLFD